MSPSTDASAPAAKSPLSRSCNGRAAPSQRPAKTPSISVPMAGMVESTPSGSHVRVLRQRWPSSSARSTHAASVRPGVSSQSAPIPSCPGTGSSVIANQ
jgi:hypothetical protein